MQNGRRRARAGKLVQLCFISSHLVIAISELNGKQAGLLGSAAGSRPGSLGNLADIDNNPCVDGGHLLLVQTLGVAQTISGAARCGRTVLSSEVASRSHGRADAGELGKVNG